MARGLTFDTGALIAFERAITGRGSSRAVRVWQRALAREVRLTVPSVAVHILGI